MAKNNKNKKPVKNEEEERILSVPEAIEELEHEILLECKALANNRTFSAHKLIEKTKELEILEADLVDLSEDNDHQDSATH